MTPLSPFFPVLCVCLGLATTVPAGNSFIKATRVCEIARIPEACIETVFFNSAGDEFSFGLGLPALGSQNGELVVNASFPLPYGFASFTLGEGSKMSPRQAQVPLQLALFVNEKVTAESNPPPLNMSHVRAQLSIGK